METMRILQIGTGFSSIPPEDSHASERVIHHLSEELTTLGHEVTVVDVRNPKRRAIPYRVEEVPQCSKDSPNLLVHSLCGAEFALHVRRRLAELLESRAFDIVNFHNQFSACNIRMVARHGPKTVYTVHNALWYKSSAWKSRCNRIKFALELRAMTAADRILVLNAATARNATQNLRLEPHKVGVVPNGIDNAWFEETARGSRVRFPFFTGRRVVLMVGRIAPYKNQLTLLKTIPQVRKEIPDVLYVFAGPVSDSSYYSEVRRAISALDVRSYVCFLGELPHSELPLLYSQADVCAVPSESEGFPLVILEAMARARPVVASDLEGFTSLLAEGRGVTVASGDHSAFGRAIVALLKDDALRTKIGRAARAYAEANYTWSEVAKKVLRAYSRLCGEN